MKRELERISGAGSVDVDSPRVKRRKETAQTAMPATTSKSNNVASDPSAIKLKQDALSLWSTIKDTTNKEGRQLSTEFLRLPSKRQYADYYQQIQNPIALDEIKSRIETGKYPNLDAVRQDLELCFKNAKKYNMKDSPIWKDAKHLHKIVNKEYTRLTGDPLVETKAADVENDRDGGSGDEGGKKKKTPNLSRILKSRLQKLVDKTDDDGRVVSAEFMELPNKKVWPGYYKVIKRPQCFENIFKKLKRKEYHTSADFSRDVQLVFSNAMEFNSEESQIHEDARTLKSYFHQLMSDLPTPHSLPEYSPSTGTSKITLRLPGTASTSTANVAVSTPVKGGSVMLRVPGLPKDPSTNATKGSEPESPSPVPSTTTRSRAAKEEAATADPIPIQPTPSTSKTTTSAATTTAVIQPPRTISTATTTANSVQTTTQPVATVPVQAYPTHYPNASYQQPIDPSRPASTTPSTTQHAPSTTSYTPTTILPTYPAYTNAGYTPTNTAAPPNPLSNLNNYGYTYGGAGFGAGTSGTTPYSTTNGISYTNTTYSTTAIPPSTPTPYYGTSSTTAASTAQNLNSTANANVVTAPAVTKTPVPVPLRTFRTVLITTRVCGRRLVLDAKEGIKVWSVRLLNKEKGFSISGVKFDIPPRSAAEPASKVETAGGGQEEEEEGDVKMNEDKEPEEEHEDDGDYEVETSPTKRGSKGKRKGKGKGKVGRPKKVKVAPPPPAPVTPVSTTVPPANAVLGEEDVTVKINDTVVPLRSPVSSSTEAEGGSDEGGDGDGETMANGKENKNKRWEWDVEIPLGSSVLEISEKGGAVWKVYVDRNFLLDGH